MNVHLISPKRLLGFWFLAFVCAYVGSLLLYTVYQLFENGIVFIFLQVLTPLVYLLFGWMYFRGVTENDWPTRLLVAIAWIGLSLLGAAVLMSPVYGYAWGAAFSAGILRGQVINLAAILVAGWVARREN